MKVSNFERKHQILDIISQRNSVSVQELADHFDVTRVTIRSDLDELASKGLIIRTHGGASAPENLAIARVFTATLNEHSEGKQWIASKAAELVAEGDTIIIDNGSTTFYLADCIRGRKLTVATGSLLVLNELMNEESIELIILGGTLRRFSMGTIGPMTTNCLAQFSTNWLFLGASSVSTKDGIYCSNLVEAETKRHMIEAAEKVCLMVDGSKFEARSLGRVCTWKDIDILITDRIEKDAYDYISSCGVKIITKEGE